MHTSRSNPPLLGAADHTHLPRKRRVQGRRPPILASNRPHPGAQAHYNEQPTPVSAQTPFFCPRAPPPTLRPSGQGWTSAGETR